MISQNFTKTHLNYEDQINLLESRGLRINDKILARKKLEHISYYRLSAYFLPFQSDKDVFIPDTHFEEILRLYYFDKALRKIIFDAIETIEVNIRANIVYNLSKETDAFGYMTKDNLAISYSDYFSLMQDIQRETRRSKESFVKHFKEKYKSDILPIWMVIEIISFGTLSKFFKALKSDHETITNKMELPSDVFKNWLHVINHIRNICAHHSRLWNRQFVIKAKLPKKISLFNEIENDKVFVFILMLKHMFKALETADGFVVKIENLIRDYPEVNTVNMGFPDNWKERLNEC